MIVLTHVLIALLSVGVASFTFFKPSVRRIGTSYGFIIATVASGTLLLITTQADILRTCLTGLLYVTVVSIMTIAAQVKLKKLATETTH